MGKNHIFGLRNDWMGKRMKVMTDTNRKCRIYRRCCFKYKDLSEQRRIITKEKGAKKVIESNGEELSK